MSLNNRMNHKELNTGILTKVCKNLNLNYGLFTRIEHNIFIKNNKNPGASAPGKKPKIN